VGANGAVVALAVQKNGKIVVGGQFTMLAGRPRAYLARLNADGTLDEVFAPPGEPTHSLAIQADGKIVIAGRFTTFANEPHACIARINPDGTPDHSFSPAAGPQGGPNSPYINALAIQADGSILVSGEFQTLNGQPRLNLGRLNPNGALDEAFEASSPGGVFTLSAQVDGGIVVGGTYTWIGGIRPAISRLNGDGVLDNGFLPAQIGIYTAVCSVAAQPNGNILIGGTVTLPGGVAQGGITRLDALEVSRQRLNVENATLTWLRGGLNPEVSFTLFEHSADGVTWTNLGTGTRIPGGWQLTDISFPPGGTLRARGYVSGGLYNGSCWFVESVWPPAVPRILVDDGSFGVRSDQFGFRFTGNAGSTVFVQGSTNLTHWVSLQTNLMPSGPLYFSDPGFTNGPGRFYRLLRSP
jgi:uncharacterized delta-60 repeat protein